MDLLPFGALTELSSAGCFPAGCSPQYSWCFCCRHGKHARTHARTHAATHTNTQGATNFAGEYYPVMGGSRTAQAPYTVTRRRAPSPTAPATCDLAPSPMISSHACRAHKLPACVTCKRLRLSAAVCCARRHHAPGYVDRRRLSKVSQAHGLPPCPRCSLMQRGVRRCCPCGHHKVNTPHKGLGKRTAPAPAGANKRPRL